MSNNQQNLYDDMISADLLPLHQQLQRDSVAWEAEQVPAPDRLVEALRDVPNQASSMALDMQETSGIAGGDPRGSPALPPTRQRRGIMGRGPVPAIAALLLIALGAAIFGLMARGHQQITTIYPHGSCAPSQITVQEPEGAVVHQIAMVSPDEGWAVGWAYQAPGTIATNGLILHFSHCHWLPVALTLPDMMIWNVRMFSSHDGWAFGTSGGSNEAVLFHYQGNQWQRVPSPVPLARGQSIREFAMTSSAEGWLSTTGASSADAQVYHAVNGHWQLVPLPEGVKASQIGITPLATQEAWFVGAGTTVWLYRNGTIVATNPPLQWATIPGFSLYVTSPQDSWIATGILGASGWQWSSRTLLRYDGTRWRDLTALISDPRVQTAVQVQMITPQEGWAFTQLDKRATGPVQPNYCGGGLPIGGALWLHNGRWQNVSWPQQAYCGITSLVEVSPVEYWAIGPIVETNHQRTLTSILHFVNGTWTAYA